MKKINSKEIQKEGWVSFLFDEERYLDIEIIDELALDTYKWALKLNVKKLKENEAFMNRVKEAKDRGKKNV